MAIAAYQNLARAHRAAYEIIKKVRPHAQVGLAQNCIWFSKVYNWPKGYAWNRLFFEMTRGAHDFIGINYYHSDRNRKEKTDMNWSIDPDGLEHVLIQMGRYKKPLFIFESGIADSADEKRAAFIRDHILAMRRAQKKGADVRGYFYWSLLDNFEWDDGFDPRFGLVRMDYKTLSRSVRKSADEYKMIIETLS